MFTAARYSLKKVGINIWLLAPRRKRHSMLAGAFPAGQEGGGLCHTYRKVGIVGIIFWSD